MSEGGEIPGRRKSRRVILTSLVLNEQRKPTVFLQRVKDLKVIQFQKIDKNRIGYDEVTNKPMIPINSHSNIFFYIFSSTCLNYDSRFVFLIYMSQLYLGAPELYFTDWVKSHSIEGISLIAVPSPHYYLNKWLSRFLKHSKKYLECHTWTFIKWPGTVYMA